MGRDNRRNEVERLARLMPAGPLRRHLACVRRREPEHFPSQRRSKHIRTGRAGRTARGSEARAARRLARSPGAALFLGGRGSVAGWDAGRNDRRTSPPRCRGRGGIRERSPRSGKHWRPGAGPAPGARGATQRGSKARRHDERHDQAKWNPSRRGRHYITQRSVMYSGGTKWSEPPLPEASAKRRAAGSWRRCASPMLCDVIAKQVP
jgi:hypothetical protein